MKKKIRLFLLGLILLFLVIQFIPVDRSNPPHDPEMEIKPPPEVAKILENSCYDCHSNKTKWPFYSYIAPVSWFIKGHVEEGRQDMNFSEWAQIPATKRDRLNEKITEEVMEGEMPLPVYLLLHPGAKLNSQQKQAIKEWGEAKNDE